MPHQRLGETDICDRFITPALEQPGWLREQMRREYSLTDGRIIVRGRLVSRGRQRRADDLLSYAGVPLAVIEAKDNSHAVGDGLQQALTYAEALQTELQAAEEKASDLRDQLKVILAEALLR